LQEVTEHVISYPDSTMASSVRKRKKAGGRQAAPEAEDTKKDEDQTPDLEPNLNVAISIILVFTFFVGLLLFYKVDQRNNGPFAAFINNNLLPKNRYQKGL
jgi:hypothetical protein